MPFLTSQRTMMFGAILACSLDARSVLADSADVASKKPPQFILKNDTLKLTVFLPDSENGYYRGTRFDWSGLVGQAEYKGHTFFGPWKTTR